MTGNQIKEKREQLNLTQVELAELIGVSRNTIINYERGSVIPTSKLSILEKILNEEQIVKHHKATFEVTPRKESDYIMVEYANLRASAGRLGMGELDLLPESHTRLIPKDYANGKYLVVGVDGNSMYDGLAHSLSDGDEILIYLNEDGVNSDLPIKKTIFVITTRDGNVLKQILEINKAEGYVLCHSWNKDFEDFKIRFEDIYQIFTVCKVVQKQISLI